MSSKSWGECSLLGNAGDTSVLEPSLPPKFLLGTHFIVNAVNMELCFNLIWLSIKRPYANKAGGSCKELAGSTKTAENSDWRDGLRAEIEDPP